MRFTIIKGFVFFCLLLFSVKTTASGPAGTKSALKVPPGCQAVANTIAEPYTNTGYAREVIEEKTGLELVFIPAGEFEMGSPEDEWGRFPDETLHKVKLSRPFYLGKYEVTQDVWEKVMGDNPSWFRGPRYPVESMCWERVDDFCRKTGFQLPTEAQWEYACRAGTQTRFSSGNKERDIKASGWYLKNSPNTTHPVGKKKPNGWGLYDMHGNVWEWCRDFYGPYPKETVLDPKGPEKGSLRVVRGGTRIVAARYCRSAARCAEAPKLEGDCGVRGFRVILESAKD